MAIKVEFDTLGNPQLPTMVLAKRNGYKLGEIIGHGVTIDDNMNSASEIQFEIDKYDGNGDLTHLWYSVRDFRLLWCKEWDMWFEITVELDEDTETTKTVFCTQLGPAELSQINLYDIEINTEDDIARDDYEIPTVLYNPEHPEASLLNRITEHAPHYEIDHVDSTIMNIQRTFSFDSISIYDAFQEIAEEIECIFVFESNSNEDGTIHRSYSVYDLDSNCNSCGYRGDFTDTCPECGSTAINEGYGEDTTIFITAEELANEIQFSTDTDSVKNCFKLEGGDDLMTATIRNCNPNGTDRIWYFTSEAREDMSDELQQRLSDYDELYQYYQNDYIIESIPEGMIEEYNDLVTKYREYSEDIEYMPSEIVGYPALMEAYYNTIDFALYLESELMPDASMGDTDAETEAAKLTARNLGTIAVADVSSLSTASANSAVLGMAKVLVDARYQVKVNEGDFGAGQQWTGNFKVTNYSDEEDTAISDTITVTISDDYEEYLRQMIEKEINSEDSYDYSINALFKLDYDEFCEELKKYCLASLTSFYDAGQACLNILIEQGIADKETWGSEAAGADSNLYEKLYLPYYDKQAAIEAEMLVRENEIEFIEGSYDEYGLVEEYGFQTFLIDEQGDIQAALNFEDYVGEELWIEFSAFRREDKYSNSNYVSDGLNNAELFSNALEFLEIARKDIYKSAELQHSIASTLKDLLVIDKFAPLIDYFETGNWLRIKVDDSIYKLRLISYGIDYDNISTLSVDFSDVMKTIDGISDKKSILDQATSMAGSYDATQRQASQGSKAYGTVDGWSLQGLDVDNVKLIQSAENETQSWDSHGMLFRRYDEVTDSYYSEQLKIIHSTMVITDDNWETVRTAVGGFYYYDPVTGDLKYAYGINGEVLVGQLILGENLGIYNESGSLTFDENGLVITNGKNTFTLDPNSEQLLVLTKGNTDIFWVDSSGDAHFSGNLDAASGSFSGEINATKGYIGNWIIGTNKIYNDLSVYDRTAVMQAPYAGMTYVFAAGGKSHDSYSDCPFRVTKDGNLYAESATFGGTTYFEGAGISVGHNVTSGCGIWFRRYESSTLISGMILTQGTIYGTSYNNSFYVGDSNYPITISGSYILLNASNYVHIGNISLGQGSSGNMGMYDWGNEYWMVYRDTSGRICLGNSSVSTILYGSGVYLNGTSTAVTSDIKLKSNVQSLSSEEENLIDKLVPRQYAVDCDPDKKHIGFVAQEVEEAMVEVGMNPDDYGLTDEFEDGNETLKAIRYEEFIPLLIYEVQKLKKEVEGLRNGK